MKLEEQVVSVDIAKKLKAIGIPQESVFYWVLTVGYEGFQLVPSEDLTSEDFDLPPVQINQDAGCEEDLWKVVEIYSAFTVAELGEILPRCYMSWATPQTGEMKWWCHRVETYFVTHKETPIFSAATEADARAKMVLHLKETGK